jgi:type III secretion protein V
MMIVPLPTFLLDVFLTVNTVAVTILMVSLYVFNGTQIASYPTLLLLTTLYRLSLEISPTRLILLKADAGEVIKAFGCLWLVVICGGRGHLPDHHAGPV